MNIFHLFRNLKYGGCQTLALTLINELKDDNHYIIYLNEEVDQESSMFKSFFIINNDVLFLDQRKLKLKEIELEIENYISINGGGVLLSWFYPYSLKLKLKFPILHHAGMAALPFYSVQWLKNVILFRFLNVMKSNDMVVYASNHIFYSHQKSYLYFPKNSSIIYNAVDHHKFKFSQKIRSYAPKKFIMVGRLDGSKDFDSFIDLAATITQEYRVKFYIAGDGNDRRRLEEKNKNLNSPVLFLGNVSNLNEELLNYDVMIFLNKPIEGFGNVIVEAMLSGLLVISNNIGASKEIIVNNVTGILVDDYKSLVITVSSLLKNSDIDIEKMVFNAYQDAVKRFSSKGFSQEYKVCLEKILNDSSCHQ